MEDSNWEKVRAMSLQQYGGKEEVIINSSGGSLRIDLKPEDIRLWWETMMQHSNNYNLLLACESNTCELMTTRLTWVVGSAIRPAVANDAKAVVEILKSLDVKDPDAELVSRFCPGLGEDIPWAFYLNRHNLLCASPILKQMSNKISHSISL